MNNSTKKYTLYQSELLGESYVKYTHTSGLDIYIFPKKMSTTYALFGVKYGSINNSFITHDGRTVSVPDGIAHFLEHKLFFNEDGSDSFERFSDYGADANAYTSFNKTAYLFSCTDNFEESFAELLTFVTHPYFTKESVESEIGIISEEIKMYDDSPSDRCFYGMLEGMYENHSIRRNICGTVDSIKQITAETLYDCYNAFYRPDNMVLTVCGDVVADEVARLADKYLPVSFSSKAVCKVNENDTEPQMAYREYVEQKMQVAKPLFSIGFKDTDIPSDSLERQKKDAAMAIVNEVLFSRAGEFYSSLFERKLISPAMSYGYTISEAFAYNSIAGEADDPCAVLDELVSYLEEVKNTGLDKAEFERAKKVMYAESVRLFDSVESISNTLFSFACEDANTFDYVQLLGEVTFEDAQAYFEKFFSNPSITLSVVKPLS